MHLHLNPLGGLAGDMFCAALLDAFPELLERARQAVETLTMPCAVRIELDSAEGSLSGKRFLVRPTEPEPGHAHHTPFRKIRALLDDAPLESGVRDRALAIFTRLAEAEASVHGVDPASVELHEVGAWDSIADIVSSAALLEALDVRSASCAPLPLGSGRVESAHGLLPVPAPATAILLRGLAVTDDGVGGERITPTGAAILQSLAPHPKIPAGAVLNSVGRGFGSRKLRGIPNCLQILCLETPSETSGIRCDQVEQIHFEVDDQNPEDLAIGLERLREIDGVLSVTLLQAIGKKGRPTMPIEILANPDRLDAIANACFTETTTIGLRHQRVNRLILARDQKDVDVLNMDVGVKIVRRPNGFSAKAESDDVSGIAGTERRGQLRRVACAAGLEQTTALDKETKHG